VEQAWLVFQKMDRDWFGPASLDKHEILIRVVCEGTIRIFFEFLRILQDLERCFAVNPLGHISAAMKILI
tara:strand:+ start:271 stop:480 length:210 start_codon:yes stop_codon:yes gene_type:complete